MEEDKMSVKTEVVRARVKPETKFGAQGVLDKLGLTISDAINLLLVQIKMKQALPFDVQIPNKETRRALEQSEKGIGLTSCKNVEDLYQQLGI
jgi:DNA-damage-inducible protein J